MDIILFNISNIHNLTMKKFILLIALVVVAISVFAQSGVQTNNTSTFSSTGGYEYTPSTKTYTAKKTTRNKVEPTKTEYKYQDRKGVEHDIYISSRGRCFYYVTNKDGEQDKRYVGEEMSRKIASEMGIEYKEKNIK